MPPRSSWKLCPTHTTCHRCQQAINSWKRKAWRHAGNAQALKFVLMCLAEADPQDHVPTEPTGHIGELPALGPAEGELKSQCGICKENYTCRGERNMCALTCSHTVCLSCIKGIKASGRHACPYCREPIKKVIVLRYDAPADDDEDSDDEPIAVPRQ